MPLFFSLNFLNPSLVTDTVFGFICFSLLSSVVYILNDIRDMEKDRLHSAKRLRPLASGKIPVPHAVAVMAFLSAVLIAMLVMVRTQGNRLFSFEAIGLLLLYTALNVAYSWGLKNLPIADVTILASGYVIRVLFGAVIIGVNVSVWLYLVVTLGAYYMGFGKRRNEITGNETATRRLLGSIRIIFSIRICMCARRSAWFFMPCGALILKPWKDYIRPHLFIPYR